MEQPKYLITIQSETEVTYFTKEQIMELVNKAIDDNFYDLASSGKRDYHLLTNSIVQSTHPSYELGVFVTLVNIGDRCNYDSHHDSGYFCETIKSRFYRVIYQLLENAYLDRCQLLKQQG